MSKHVQILAKCLVAYSSTLALIGVFLAALPILMGGLLFQEHDAFVGGAVFLVFALIVTLPGYIAAIGLRKFKRWARIVALSFGVIHLVVFPFGTALGIYALWVLLSPNSWALFEPAQA